MTFIEFLRGVLCKRQAVKPPPRVPVPGEYWYFKNTNGDPWPPIDYAPVEILDAKEGWVRYFMNDRFPDLRRPLKDFLLLYSPTEDIKLYGGAVGGGMARSPE